MLSGLGAAILAGIEWLSAWAIPLFLIGIPLLGFVRRVPVYEAFVEGAQEGLEVSLRLLPYLVAMFTALALLRESGAMDLLVLTLAPLGRLFGVPEEVIPLALIRPLSGSGALGLLADLLHRAGPDSFAGRLGSAIQGSTETTFYVLTVYFGAVGVKKFRHAPWAGLIADVAGVLAAAAAVRAVFGAD